MTGQPGPSAPLLSVITPVFWPDPAQLRETIDSVSAQDFADWELLLIDDSGDGMPPEIAALLSAAASDGRVRVLRRPVNGGFVAAANDGIALARGQFIAFLDHDDVLEPTALGKVAAAVTAHPAVDLLYTDEAHLSPDHLVIHPFRKPDFSPERLRGQMFIGALSVYRSELVRSLGGVRPGFDGAEHHDLALRVSERSAAVLHLADVLYLHRMHPRLRPPRVEPAVVAASSRRAVGEHLARIGIPGTVEPVIDGAGVHRIRRELDDPPLISVVIPSRGSSATVRGESRCLVVAAVRSIVEKSSYPRFEIVVVLDAAAPPSVLVELAELAGDRLRVVPWTGPFNFSAKINRGVLAAAGEYAVLLNDDVEVISEDWLEALLGPSLAPDVGMVGAMLLFEDGTIQHAGQATHHGGPGHIGYNEAGDAAGPYDAYLVEREVSGVTAACAMVRRSDFLEVGGLSLELPVNFNDVDFGQKLRAAGKRMIWTPHARLFHFESKSRTALVAAYEINTLNDRWGRWLTIDPFWHHVEAVGDPNK